MTDGAPFDAAARSRDLLASLPDPTVIFERRGRVVAANRGAEAVFGYRRDEMIGLRLDTLVPACFRGSHARLHASYAVRPVARAMRRGRALMARRKDGTEFPAEISIGALRSRGGPAFVAAVRDLTGRDVAREAREREHRRYLQRLITAQDDERRRIARELHDEAGQALASLIVRLRALQDAATLRQAKATAMRLRKVVADTIGGLGRLARGLHPGLLDDLGLGPALKRFAADSAEAFGVAIRVSIQGLGNRRLPAALETALYRIAQEAITNVARHAGATRVEVTLAASRAQVRLTVVDDGRGFDPLAQARGAHRLGLVGIRERAAALGGTATVDSAPGRGTTVLAALPLGSRGSDLPRGKPAARRRIR